MDLFHNLTGYLSLYFRQGIRLNLPVLQRYIIYIKYIAF